jgi:hypothetical protein
MSAPVDPMFLVPCLSVQIKVCGSKILYIIQFKICFYIQQVDQAEKYTLCRHHVPLSFSHSILQKICQPPLHNQY